MHIIAETGRSVSEGSAGGFHSQTSAPSAVSKTGASGILMPERASERRKRSYSRTAEEGTGERTARGDGRRGQRWAGRMGTVVGREIGRRKACGDGMVALGRG